MTVRYTLWQYRIRRFLPLFLSAVNPSAEDPSSVFLLPVCQDQKTTLHHASVVPGFSALLLLINKRWSVTGERDCSVCSLCPVGLSSVFPSCRTDPSLRLLLQESSVFMISDQSFLWDPLSDFPVSCWWIRTGSSLRLWESAVCPGLRSCSQIFLDCVAYNGFTENRKKNSR